MIAFTSQVTKAALGVALVVACTSFIHAGTAFEIGPGEQELIDLANQERQRVNLPPLKPNPLLFQAARAHALDMARCGECEHTLHGKDSTKRIEATGYKWIETRENIAYNERSTAEVHRDWMQSEGHRNNLLAPNVTEIGIGMARNGKGEYYFVQNFARPQSDLKTTTFELVSSAPKSLRFEFAGKASVLKPGVTIKYSLATADALPLAHLSDGSKNVDLTVENGARYQVWQGQDGWHVSSVQANVR